MKLARCVMIGFVLGGALGGGCAPVPSPSPAPAPPPTFRRGVVVNHWLAANYDEVHSYGGAWFDEEDVRWIAEHGFDHVRVRVSAQGWLTADGRLDAARLAPLDRALGWAAAHGLGLVVAMTAFPGVALGRDRPAGFGDAAVQDAAAGLWRRVAERYAGHGDGLRFEVIHAPHARPASGAADLTAFQRRALGAIRAASPARFVYLTVDQMSFDAVSDAVFPDPRVGLALDYGAPAAFTLQFDESVPLVAFPATGAGVAEVDADFARLAAWARTAAAGREVYVAEFGVYRRADVASQQAYLRAVAAALGRHRLAWAIYDYESGCAMRGADGMPTPAYAALGLRPAPIERRYTMLEGGEPAGAATLRVDGRHVAIAAPEGDKVRRIAITLDDRGVPVRYRSQLVGAGGEGGDAVGAGGTGAADDTLVVDGDHARWTHPAGTGTAVWRDPTFYVPFHDDPFALALLADALAGGRSAPGARGADGAAGDGAARLRLSPDGHATLETLGTRALAGAQLTQRAIIGADLAPRVVWTDAGGAFAVLGGDRGFIAQGHEAQVAALAAAQQGALDRRAEALAARALHRPARGLVIRGARLFDARTLDVRPDTSVLILDHRIAAVGPDGSLAVPPGVDEIDARGRFVMPGLWDSHAHLFSPERAMMHLAAGVTTVREMGNEGDLAARLRRYDAGLELGPRAVPVVRFGWDILPDAPKVTTEAEARQVVETFAARGYAQVKVLDGFDPALVPALARFAHARGLRLSGHVPSRMTVRQFIEAGADEIQHIPSLLKDQKDKVLDGRAPPAGSAAEGRRGSIDGSARDLLALMARRRVTLDPTLAQFELAATGGLGRVEAALADRVPPLALRAFQRDALPPERQASYRQRFAVWMQLVKAAYDQGVTVVPGTDALIPGFLLRRELELYVEAGIPAARVLQMATHGAARNMKLDHVSGAIVPGAHADLLVIDGDPLRDLRALERVDVVVKHGAWLAPADVFPLLGIRAAP